MDGLERKRSVFEGNIFRFDSSQFGVVTTLR